ncbi:hypothetical protein [uncultured Enterococcus sp.]|uniref:hypothetical protein n=1 Tax=uncultured Enterococcus sp. TaxID=167972 RepID=UPI002AA67596|nr:hypothetical protein [uncultured Enterococcus sp.]
MPTTIMTPEEVMKYGKRIALMPEKNMKGRDTYFIEDGRLTRKEKVITGGIQSMFKDQSVSIEDIYPFIEMVFNRKTKGTVIARRHGNRESNENRQLPLKYTGRGMGGKLKAAQQSEVPKEVQLIRKVVRKNRKRQYYQEQHS